ERGDLALCRRRRTCAIAQRRCRSRRENPEWPRRRRRSGVGLQALSSHSERGLPDHAADDRRTEYMTSIRVLSVASEIYPIIKTGGLADVAGALPIALKAEGIEVRSLIPGYPAVMDRLRAAEQLLEWPLFFGGVTRLLKASCGELDLLVIDAPHLFARPGNPYTSPEGIDWPDNGLRFAALSRMAADIGLGDVPAFVPHVVHVHDWQAGLAPAYLRYAGRQHAGTVMTVHNLAYQGQFPPALLDEFGLP